MFIVTTTSNKTFEEGTLQLTIEAAEHAVVNDNFADLVAKINTILDTTDRHGGFST